MSWLERAQGEAREVAIKQDIGFRIGRVRDDGVEATRRQVNVGHIGNGQPQNSEFAVGVDPPDLSSGLRQCLQPRFLLSAIAAWR